MAIERAGAPQGNLNSAKSVLPALRRLRRGKPLPPELTRIAALADREAEELISDRGGWEGMSGAEQLMVANWKAARQAELIILAGADRQGSGSCECRRVLGLATRSPASGLVLVGSTSSPHSPRTGTSG